MAVASGLEHTAAVTEDGGLWAWGAGDKGQLGLTALEHRPVPIFLGGPEVFSTRFVMLAAGFFHSAALAEDGAVCTWGRGLFGALGHGDEQARSTPTRLDKEAFGGSPAVMVACGARHTMVVTADGGLWTFGQGVLGLLGHGDGENKRIPTRVGAMRFGGAKIVMAVAGACHSMAATADGDVYTWGDGRDGVLGQNDNQCKLVPAKLHRELFQGSKVVVVAAGAYHSVAVTAEGALFSWGLGASGQLGLGDHRNRLTPTRVGAEEAFDGSRVLMAACGVCHTLVVTQAGALWSCGSGNDGALGHDDKNIRLIPTRVDAQHFDGAKIVTAAAGRYVSTAVTEDGALFSWGTASVSETPTGLGHTDMQDKLVPTRFDHLYMQGARVGSFQSSLPPQHALAFAMCLHKRLGEWCHKVLQDENLVKMVVERCVLWPEGGSGELEGVVRLMGGVRIKGGE